MREAETLLSAINMMADADCFLFDMDGLIFDTERLFMEQLTEVMAEYGYELTRDVYVKTLGLGGERLKELMCSYYGEDYPFEKMGHITQQRIKHIAKTEGLLVKPEIREVLEWLHDNGKKMAVASTSKSTSVKTYLSTAGLINYFGHIVGGDMVKHSKPEPDIFLLAAHRMGCEPAQCVVLEDSENGIRAAHSAGMRSICVPDLKEPSKEVQEIITVLVHRTTDN